MIPLHSDRPRILIEQPWVTWGLIALCATIFALQVEVGPETSQRWVLGLGAIPAVLVGEAQLVPALALVPDWATLITYQFLHGDAYHLIFNMAYLWVFGDKVEDAMGHLRFLVFYLLCGALAALVHLAADPSSTVPIIGASGAISGVLGAFLLLYPKVRILVPLVFFIPFYLPAYLLLAFWIGYQIYSALGLGAGASPVAWWAHIGGFAVGLALVIPFRHKTIPLWGDNVLPRGLRLMPRGRWHAHNKGEVDDPPDRKRPWS
ncbi:MAG: rhomboid family intramembrane serine protease [Pseudomonadota bacterium]